MNPEAEAEYFDYVARARIEAAKASQQAATDAHTDPGVEVVRNTEGLPIGLGVVGMEEILVARVRSFPKEQRPVSQVERLRNANIIDNGVKNRDAVRRAKARRNPN